MYHLNFWILAPCLWATVSAVAATPCLMDALPEVLVEDPQWFHIRPAGSDGYEVLIPQNDGSFRLVQTHDLNHARDLVSAIKNPIDVKEWIHVRTAALEEITPRLQEVFESEKGIQFRTRIKKHTDLRNKIFLKVKKLGAQFRLENVDDVAGARFITTDQAQLQRISDRIANTPGFGVKREVIAYPSGYRAHHLTIRTPSQNLLEIQVMTERTSRWSNWEHDLVYKPDASLDATYLENLKKYDKRVIQYLNALDDNSSPRPPRPQASQEGIRPEHAFPEQDLH